LYSFDECQTSGAEFWIGLVHDFMVVIVAIKKLSEVEAESSNVVGFVLKCSFLGFFSKFCYLEEEFFIFFCVE